MRSLAFLFAVATSPLATAQEPATVAVTEAPHQHPFSLRTGLSFGKEVGAFGGISFKNWTPPMRLDLDAWSAFREFGDRSAGVALTANWIRTLKGYYLGVGVGYARATERGKAFDSVATKFIVGSRLSGMMYLEGGTLWTQHAIGSGHTIGTVSLVFRL